MFPALYQDKKYIDVSHERCNSNGLSRDSVFSARMLSGQEFQKTLDLNHELLSIAAPFMNQLYDFVRGTDFFALVTDSRGCILSAVGDDKILSEAFELKMIPGAFMDEESIGTNAMSVVLSEQIPVQVSGKEHYVNAYHRWTCSAAPIRDVDGSMIGVLDLTGYLENVHPHTLGMVVEAANAIEKMIQINRFNVELSLAKRNTEVILNSISSAIITSDVEGNILMMNTQAIEMFGSEIKDMWKLMDNWSRVIEVIYTTGNLADEFINANSKEGKKQYTLTTYPVYDGNHNVVSIIHVIYEVKKGRKLAGRILSGQAIYTFDKIIGRNEAFLKTVEYAKKIADSKSTILITGESGTGKEIFAQSIHNFSGKREEPFIAVNCGAIPRTLIESELFGYEDGAFTGARKGGVAGKFELADGGTIFLDEIGEMPFDMQIKLLRVIEEGVITRIGSETQVPVNVRIIAATNKNLKEEVEKGNFRKDLYYRLNVLPVVLPSLRERRDDIHLLIDYYMRKTSKRLGKQVVYIANRDLQRMEEYDWPGNIRELENMIELMINTEHVNLEFMGGKKLEAQSEMRLDTSLTLDELEHLHILETLKANHGKISTSAQSLGIGRNTLYRKLEKYGINPSLFVEELSSEA